jgi:cytoskeletal protein CcmA (bactofilin family)
MTEAHPERTATPAEPPLLARGTEFHGLVVIHGSARIEGRVHGEVMGAERLEIGRAGALEARVEAEEVVVAGSLEGEVRARRRVELLATARVRGTIETPRLALVDGALFEGHCRTGVACSCDRSQADQAAAP